MAEPEPSNVPRLVTTRPDSEVAKELKERVSAALVGVMSVLDDARAAGFQINFNLGNDYLGKTAIQMLTVAKQF